ncbi:MAG TPA: sulfite exporter TauE/SafE family protein, partial [Steroidobacteraceae bacterium]|nr:sulfite exporter TauE/SafE family protein [Steroidobacteraceae bacterium]
AWLAHFIPGAVQLLWFAGVMLVAAWRMCCGPPSPEKKNATPRVQVIGAGAGVGLLSGLVGVGGGFLIVPALVLLAGLPMRLAIGTSLVVIAMNSTVGFLKYLSVLESASLSVDWHVIGTFALIGAVGSLIGNRIGARLPQHALRKGFAVFLALMVVLIVYETLPRL